MMDAIGRLLRVTPLVPATVVFLVAPSIALRKYIAVTNLDAPKTVEETAGQKRPTRWQALRETLKVLALEGAGIWLGIRGPKILINVFEIALCSAWYYDSLHLMIYDFVAGQGVRNVVYRDQFGRNKWRRQFVDSNSAFVAKCVATAGAFAFVPVVYFFPLPPFQWIVSASLAVRYVAAAQGFRVSLRIFLISTCTCVCAWALLTGIAMFLIELYFPTWSNKPTVGSPDTSPHITKEVATFIVPLISIGFVAIQGLLVSICYRFDYSLHLARIALEETPVTVETVSQAPSELARVISFPNIMIRAGAPPPAGSEPSYSPGIAVAAKGPSGFSKVYYWTVILTWFFTQILVTAYVAYFPAIRDSIIRAVNDLDALITLSFMTCPLSVLSTSLAVIVTSSVRGEFATMWKYVEEWRPVFTKPEPVVDETPFEDDDAKDAAEVEAILQGHILDEKA